MKLTGHNSRRRNNIIIVVALIMMISGGYLLYSALSPAIGGQFINPIDNSTTELLKDDQKISENRLYIPKIDVNVTYKFGGEEALEQGAWWRKPNNGNPEKGGNFVLSAHRFVMGLTPQQTSRKSPFYNIHRLEVGDEIVVDYNSKRYTYAVDKKFAVKPDAVEIEEPTTEPQLTLYSCTFGGASDGREVFVAKLKSTPVPNQKA